MMTEPYSLAYKQKGSGALRGCGLRIVVWNRKLANMPGAKRSTSSHLTARPDWGLMDEWPKTRPATADVPASL